ncbi:MAG TPA: substrate-binding domain-containing protein [Solirubrobacterales bacterium]|nr:substrate-binding domain-containing protein [Solirubrobacterales bacterium]
MSATVSRRLGLLALSVIAAVAVAACGGDDGNGGGGDAGGKASAGDVAKYERELAALYEGTYEEPSGGPVEPPQGKNVWVISTGQTIEAAVNASTAMEEAGRALGWDVTVFDGRFDSNRQIAGVEQALADGADGLILIYIDCPPIKSALQQARADGVAVVGIQSLECEPPLEDHVIRYARHRDFVTYLSHGFGGTQAKWVIAKTKGQAKTIVTAQTDLYSTRVTYDPGVTEAFARCETCEIVDTVEFVGSEFGPPLQQKIEQSLNQHPEANSFIAAYDAVMTGGGGAAALRASGRLDELEVMGGEGSKPGIEQIYDRSGMQACTGTPTGWEGYAAIMSMARVFAGQDPERGDSGIGEQVCDIDHNLPPRGEGYQAPIDYVAAYRELWGLDP